MFKFNVIINSKVHYIKKGPYNCVPKMKKWASRSKSVILDMMSEIQ